MRILLTNDDGIESEGLTALASALKKAGHRPFVVAPDRNNSAVSHKLTMFGQVGCAARRVGGCSGFSVTGTPADCVLLALSTLGIAPELVLSGINDGMNAGSDVLYSGTVAAAYEGKQNGIASVALSLDTRPLEGELSLQERSALYAYYAAWVAERLEELHRLAKGLSGILNVNFPACDPPRGERVAAMVKTKYVTSYRREGDGFQMQFHPPMPAEGEGDITLLREGYITLTPLLLDMTDHAAIARWQA